jgi:hypothetical protein
MLLLKQRVRSLERLELRDLTRWTGRQRFRSSPAESAVPQILSPLRQHERVDLQRSGDPLHLHPGVLTQANGRELKLVAYFRTFRGPDRGIEDTPYWLGGSVYKRGARTFVSFSVR